MEHMHATNEWLKQAAERGVGAYTGRRLRSQRDIIRDVLLAASGLDAWMTLEELRALTRFAPASISAQMRHLRKSENGGFAIRKRHREKTGEPAPLDGRGAFLWEYRIFCARGLQGTAEVPCGVGE